MATAKQAYALKDIHFDRVDVVTRGANYDPATGDGAHILLAKVAPDATTKASAKTRAAVTKSAGLMRAAIAKLQNLAVAAGGESAKIAKQAPLRTVSEQLDVNEAHGDICELMSLWYTFTDVAHQIVEQIPAAGRDALLQQAAADFSAQLMLGLSDADDASSDDAMTDIQGVALNAADVEKIGRKISASRMKALKQMHGALSDLIASAEPASTDDKTTKGAPTMSAVTDPKIVDITKSDEFKAALAKGIADASVEAQAAVTKLRADVDAASAIAKTERDARRTIEFTKRLQEGLKGLPGLDVASGVPFLKQLEDDLSGKVSKTADGKDESIFGALLSLLEKAATAIRTSKAMSELGVPSDGSVAADSAADEVMTLARKMVADGKATSIAKAITDLTTSKTAEHQALMKRYDAEQAAKRGTR